MGYKKHKILTGKKFGKLLVISDPIRMGKYIKYQCLCDCGKTTMVFSYSLTSLKTTSCGCFGKEQRIKSCTKHDFSKSRFYTIWEGIIRRCTSKKQKEKQKSYLNCTIDPNWLDFINFKNDMYNSYLKYIEIHNILPEIDKDIFGQNKYSKENCIWVNPKVNRAQSVFKRNNIKYIYNVDMDTITREL